MFLTRRAFLKLIPLGAIPWFAPRSKVDTPLPGTMNVQQDPPDTHWADAIYGLGVIPNALVEVDASGYVANAKIIWGYFSVGNLEVNTPWLVENRPNGLPGALGLMPFITETRQDEVTVQAFFRVNAGKFQIRANRAGMTAFDWSFSPVAWWA